MELYELPHAKIIKHSDDIAEVIVNQGVDYDLVMVEAYHQWLRENMLSPCYIMVNRINSYSLTFAAQQKLAEIENIRAIALVTYTRSSKLASQILSQQWTLMPLDCEIFDSPMAALQWLKDLRDADKQDSHDN